MKKLFTLLCALALTFTLAGCGSSNTTSNNQGKETNPAIQDIQSSDQIDDNRLTGFATLGAANQYADLNTTYPDSFGKWNLESVYAKLEAQVEILYLDEAKNELRTRISTDGMNLVSEASDLEESTLEYDKATVNIKTKDDLIFEASYTKDNEQFSLVCDTGVTSEDLVILLDALLTVVAE